MTRRVLLSVPACFLAWASVLEYRYAAACTPEQGAEPEGAAVQQHTANDQRTRHISDVKNAEPPRGS